MYSKKFSKVKNEDKEVMELLKNDLSSNDVYYEDKQEYFNSLETVEAWTQDLAYRLLKAGAECIKIYPCDKFKSINKRNAGKINYVFKNSPEVQKVMNDYFENKKKYKR